MPAPIDPKIKAAIEEAYVNSNVSPEALAEEFSVSDRSIKNWAKDGGWDAKRTAKSLIAKNVVEFAQRPKLERPPRLIESDETDSLAIADKMIRMLQSEVYGDMSGKDKAAIANCLKVWVEYREKLQPKTIGELADQMIAFMREHQIDPSELSAELKARWRAEKRA